MSELQTKGPKAVLHKVKTTLESVKSAIYSLAPFSFHRWLVAAALSIVELVRAIVTKKYFVALFLSYAFILSRFILFISPSGSMLEGSQLPTTDTSDPRPYERQLPEFQFWLNVMVPQLIVLVVSLIPALDLPVFWPLLAVYMVLLIVYVVLTELFLWKRINIPPKQAVKMWFGIVKKQRFDPLVTK